MPDSVIMPDAKAPDACLNGSAPTSNNRQVRRLMIVSLALGMLAVSSIGFVVYDQSMAMLAARKWTMHTYAVLSQLRNLYGLIRDAESGQHLFVLTGKEDYLAQCRKDYKALDPE